MTATLRPLYGIALAALLALTLVASAADALAASPSRGGSRFFDEDAGTQPSGLLLPRPLGRLGVSWE